MKKSYQFTILLTGLDHSAPDFEEKLHAAGCVDATVSVLAGQIALDFTREGETFAETLESAMRDVRKTGAIVLNATP